ncbi:MAG TPA: Tex-like N-terminal domain-containing protein, partial [Paludibacter sp.]|nr:Tex-like N-terminal domain-containing protein [Paludibacter sp.]
MSSNLSLFIKLISTSLQLSEKQVRNAVQLLEDGATIPFISRYRKEMTDGMDEVQLADTKEQYDRLCEIEKRKETILNTIGEQDKLTEELKKRIENCWNATELEDNYLPYKPKRRTKAEIAREKGLEPLAKMIMAQNSNDIERLATQFVKDKVESVEEALNGAKDIIAEWVNESE